VKNQNHKIKLIVIAVLCNILVLSVLIGIAFAVIHVFLQGKVNKTLISFFGLAFFIGTVFTTSIVYRLYMRRFFDTEHMDDVLGLNKKSKARGSARIKKEHKK
jgi:cytochrome b subunit of formate dehydrogenase